MPFVSTIRIPSEVLDAIVSLTEITTAFAVESASAESLDGPLATVRP